jgi:pimeloyl-ACP methyl ester carboxylesterase
MLTAVEDARMAPARRPRNDPFYEPPADLAQHRPGALLRSRPVRLGFLGLIPQPNLRAWQLAYRSTNLHGEAELAVTTVILPPVTANARRGLVAYQCAIDAVSDRCFPSYSLRMGVVVPGALPPFELILITSMLERGFVVSIADHEGRKGSFAAPREPGHRVLDGIRASLAFNELGLPPETATAVFGYSGGGMASAWAAEMAPTYAPELHLVGAVLGSPVGDPGEAFIKLNHTFFAGLPAMVVAGLIQIYPDLAQMIRAHSSQEGLTRLEKLKNLSTTSAVLRHRNDDFDDYLEVPLADVLARPEVLHVFNDLRLGHRTPDCPLLVVQAVHDQIIDVQDVDDLVNRYTEGGATVQYVRDRSSEHIAMMVIAYPLMMSWLEARFTSAPAPTGMSTVRSLAFSRKAWRGYAGMIGTTLRILRKGGAIRASSYP